MYKKLLSSFSIALMNMCPQIAPEQIQHNDNSNTSCHANENKRNSTHSHTYERLRIAKGSCKKIISLQIIFLVFISFIYTSDSLGVDFVHKYY